MRSFGGHSLTVGSVLGIGTDGTMNVYRTVRETQPTDKNRLTIGVLIRTVDRGSRTYPAKFYLLFPPSTRRRIIVGIF